MANYTNLKSTINAQIRQNGTGAITGPVLNGVLRDMVSALGEAGYLYKGVATPATSPGTPDSNVFYIASTAGTYTNFGGAVVADGEVAILKYNGTWTKEVTGAATAAQVTQLGQEVYGIKITSSDVINGSVQGYTLVNYRLSNAGLWAAPGKTLFVPVSEIVDELRIVPVSTDAYKYALVKSTSVSSGSSADFCTGESVHIVTGVETILKKDSLPQDCVYVAVVYKQQNTDPYAVDYVVVRDSMDGRFIRVDERLDNAEANIEKLEGQTITLQDVVDNVGGTLDVETNRRISNANYWVTSGISLFIPITGLKSIEIVPKTISNDTYKYAFLTARTITLNARVSTYCAGQGLYLRPCDGASVFIDQFPTDCAYVIVIFSQTGVEQIEKIVINGLVNRVSIIENAKKDSEQKQATAIGYYGERINLRGFSVDVFGEMAVSDYVSNPITTTDTNLAGQGGDVFGDYLFRLHQNGLCEVFDIANFQNIKRVGIFELGSYSSANHCNNAAFGQVLADTGFPYFYVSGFYNHTCYVEKVSTSGAQLVQTIVVTISGFENCNIICGDDGYLWAYGAKNGLVTFYKFNLPDISWASVELTEADAVDSWADNDSARFLESYIQGGKIYKGKIYVLFGQAISTGLERLVVVYDTTTHQRLSVVSFEESIENEIEDCAITRGKMLIITNGGYGVKVVNFY